MQSCKDIISTDRLIHFQGSFQADAGRDVLFDQFIYSRQPQGQSHLLWSLSPGSICLRAKSSCLGTRCCRRREPRRTAIPAATAVAAPRSSTGAPRPQPGGGRLGLRNPDATPRPRRTSAWWCPLPGPARVSSAFGSPGRGPLVGGCPRVAGALSRWMT